MLEIQRLLANNVRAARKALGYSQMKLAELCGVSANYIGVIEIGERFPSARVLQKMCTVLALKPDELFQDEHAMKEPPTRQDLVSLMKTLQENVSEEILRTVKIELDRRK